MKIRINGNEAIIEGEDDNFVSKLMQGCKGKIKLNTPLAKREIKLVREFESETKPQAKKTKSKKAKA